MNNCVNKDISKNILNLKQFILLLTVLFKLIDAQNDLNIEMIDRTNLNTYTSTNSIVKINCDKQTNSELQGYYFGEFLCAKSLNASPASDIPIFNFSTSIPHYQRSIRADIIHMNDIDKNAVVKIKPDDQTEASIQMNTDQTRIEIGCLAKSNSSVESDIDQFYRGSWTYNKQSSNNIKVAFDSTCPSREKISQFRVSSIQININPCHPSCSSCSGPLESDCLSCAKNNGAQGPASGKCSCTDDTYVFQYGNCVSKCDETKFLFKQNNICVLNLNCQLFSISECTKCQIGYFLIEGQCLQNCPAGYIVNGQDCISQNKNIDGIRYLKGLWRNDFSMIEINSLKISMSNYIKYNENSSIYSRCGQINFLGGFFINQLNSIITFPSQITFKYIITDYTETGSTNIFINVAVGSNTIKKEISSQNNSQQTLCGLGSAEQIGVFSDSFDTSSKDFQVSIQNLNQKCKSGSGGSVNSHSYFGMREIEIFGFNCQFQFCLTCSTSSCLVCIDGYYLNTITNVCETCNPLCATCSKQNECLTCKIGLKLDTSTKLCTCNDGYYLNNINKNCIACSNQQCKSCDTANSNICTSCYSPKVLTQDGQCMDSCPTQQYADINNLCKNCLNVSCLTCNASDSQQCLSCSAPNYLINKTCLPNCPDKYYTDTTQRKCIACVISSCKTCNPPSDNKCLSCAESHLLQNGTCVSNCGDGYYKDPNSNVCLACAIICKTCTPATPNLCLSCYSPLVINNGICQNSCGKGKFLDQGSNTCQNCMNTTCYSCGFPFTNLCTSCDTNQFLQEQNCVTNCSQGYYKNITEMKCKQCPDSNCLACDQNNPTICSKCKSPTALLNNKCVTNCGPQKYNNSLNQICTDCPSSNYCLTCNALNPTECLTCQNPRALLGTQCVNDCGDGKYIESSTSICKQCLNTDCKTCSIIDSNQCLSCNGTKALSETKCYENCPDKFYKDIQQNGNYQCKQCSNSFCKTCEPLPSTNCLSCLPPRGLEENMCVITCKPGYFIDQNQICSKCINNQCWTCDSKNTNICITCHSSKVLYQDNCLDICPDNYFQHPILRICQQCQNLKCKTCDEDNPGICMSCNSGHLLRDGDCVDQCGDKYYQLGQQCFPCENQDCKQCDQTNSQLCLECFPPKQLSKNICEHNCNEFYVFDPISDQCVNCGANCLTCDPSNISQCLSCKIPLVLQNAQCKQQCDNGMFIDLNTNECKNCNDPNCKVCNHSDTSECYSCIGQKLLNNNNCFDKCEDNMYINQNNECKQCTNPNSKCQTCLQTSPQNCSSCLSPLVLLENDCVLNCGNNKVINTNKNTCESCTNKNCKSCNFPNKDECTSCEKPLVLLQSSKTCEKNCPENFYINSQTNTCNQCANINCKTCNENSPMNCLSCKNNLYLKGNVCVNECGKGYYIDPSNNVCLKCQNSSSECLACNQIDPTQCTSCESPKALLNGNCVTDCGKGKVINTNNQTCQNCSNVKCFSCEFPNTIKCLSCESFQILTNGDCVSQCPVKSYFNPITKQCGKCENSNCEYCDHINKSNCISCSSPQIKKGQDCVDSCGDGMYVDLNTNSCKQCINSECKSCNINNSNICLSCNSPKILQNNNCIDSCGKGKYYHKQTHQCQTCPSQCLTCEEDSRCIECQSDSLLFNGFCVMECPKNKFYANKNQKKCELCKDINCLNCSLNSSICSQCDEGFELSTESTICEPCTSKDCEKNKPKNPPFINQPAEKSLNIVMTVASASMVIISPFYMLVSFFDLLQLTNYLAFINVNYSSQLYSFIQLFNFANFEFIPNIKSTSSNSPQKFKQEEYDTVLFSNIIQTIVIWAFSYVLYLMSLFIRGTNKISMFFKYYRDNYKYNIIIGLGFLTYCDIILSILLQLYDIYNISTYSIIGAVASIIFIILLLSLNFIAFKASSFNYDVIKHQKYIGFLYDGLHRKKAIMNFIFLIRKSLIIYILIFKQDFSIYQSLQILLIIGLETTFMLTINPYKMKKELSLNIFGRVLIIISLTFITWLSLDDSINNLNTTIRSAFEIFIMICLSSLYVSQLVYIIYSFIQLKSKQKQSLTPVI